jgi:hypothetical protein
MNGHEVVGLVVEHLTVHLGKKKGEEEKGEEEEKEVKGLHRCLVHNSLPTWWWYKFSRGVQRYQCQQYASQKFDVGPWKW